MPASLRLLANAMPAPEHDPLPDLLSRTALGDRKAFRALYELSAPRLYGIALGLLRRREHAEEVLQDSFVCIWHRAATYRPGDARPISWMIAIVRNQALDRLRQAGRRQEAALPDEDDDEAASDGGAADPLGLLERSLEALRVRQCMGELVGHPRQCLALAYYRGLSHGELAEHLDAPLGSVKVWLRRGLQRLRRCLEALP